MNLTIDQGNSSTKIGFFDKGALIATYKLLFIDQKSLAKYTEQHPPDNVIVSSVTGETDYLIDHFQNLRGKLIFFNHTTPIPIHNEYKTPETLGKDRLAGVIGAWALYPNQPLLVIDAGTAITFDLLTDDTYLGGNISPGLQMRFTALNEQTRNLPLVEQEPTHFWGTTTEEAIRSGVQNSVLMEIESYINKVKTLFSDAKTIITGGDADFFASYTKNLIFVHPNLVLSGLNRIIEYNAKN